MIKLTSRISSTATPLPLSSSPRYTRLGRLALRLASYAPKSTSLGATLNAATTRAFSRCRLLGFCDLVKQINQDLIRLPSLRRKARDAVADVGTVERRIFVDLSSEEALAHRTIWNEADPKFL